MTITRTKLQWITIAALIFASGFGADRELRKYEPVLPPIVRISPPAAPDIERDRIPYPICFGKTVIGNGTIINQAYFDDSPLLIIGDDTKVEYSNFTGGRWGIYVMGVDPDKATKELLKSNVLRTNVEINGLTFLNISRYRESLLTASHYAAIGTTDGFMLDRGKDIAKIKSGPGAIAVHVGDSK